MPERWRTELRSLNEVHAPVDRIKSRAAHGPTGEPATDLPPRRQRLVAGVVAFAVFIAAGAFAWQAFQPGPPLMDGPDPKPPPPPAVLDFDGSGDQAKMTLTFEGETFEATPVGYTWCDESGANCESGKSDYDVGEFHPIPVGTPIVIEGDAFDVSGRFALWQDPCGRDCEFEMRSSVPSEPGEYELLVDASFPRGQVQFSVGVEVVQPGLAQPAATMSFVGKNAPEGTI